MTVAGGVSSRRLTLLAFCLSAAGCAALPPRAADGPPFAALETPAGQALVYFFRPGFTTYRGAERPELYIDGRLAFRLAWKGYAPEVLAPGDHRIEIRPGIGESADWRIAVTIRPEADQHYFLAVWNTAVAGPVPWFGVVPLGHSFYVMTGEAKVYTDTGTRYELVAEADALPILRECRLMTDAH